MTSLKLVSLPIKMMFNVFLPLSFLLIKHLIKCIILTYKQYKIILMQNITIYISCSDIISLQLTSLSVQIRNKLSYIIYVFQKYFLYKVTWSLLLYLELLSLYFLKMYQTLHFTAFQKNIKLNSPYCKMKLIHKVFPIFTLFLTKILQNLIKNTNTSGNAYPI